MNRKNCIFILTVILLIVSSVTPVHALGDGVYVMSNSTSYANPDTGKTEDGGSNLDIGDAMARSLTQPLTLYEVKNGKHFLTVRIGLSSFTRDMRINVQSEKNRGTGYQPVPYDIVKENKETDTAEYRFEVSSPDLRFSVTFFVKPMNRDVIFFVTPDPTTAKLDKGAFAASDKAASGYGAGFTGGLTGGNAEAGKMPALVEQLTGVAEVKKEPNGAGGEAQQTTNPSPALPAITTSGTVQQTTAPAVPPVTSAPDREDTAATGPGETVPGSSKSGSDVVVMPAETRDAPPVHSVTETQKASGGAESSAEAVQEQQLPGTGEAPAANETAPDLSQQSTGLEEKIPSGSTAGLADQGITQFDSSGNLIEEQAAEEKAVSPVLILAGILAVAAATVGYFLYNRKKKAGIDAG